MVNARCQILEMDVQNINEWKYGKKWEIPYSENIVYVRFEKGTHLFRYKKDLHEQEMSVSIIIRNSIKIADLKNAGKRKQHEALHQRRRGKLLTNLST